WIEDVFRPLRLKKRECRRLFRVLTCPGCESAVQSGSFVLGADPKELRCLALSKKFDRLYAKHLKDFRDLLLEHPMLGAEHPLGKLLANAVNRATKVTLEPGSWFRATKKTAEPF